MINLKQSGPLSNPLHQFMIANDNNNNTNDMIIIIIIIIKIIIMIIIIITRCYVKANSFVQFLCPKFALRTLSSP